MEDSRKDCINSFIKRPYKVPKHLGETRAVRRTMLERTLIFAGISVRITDFFMLKLIQKYRFQESRIH
jgi:hypothetical protein